MVITGRLSIRDDKDPQIVINRARPISDFADQDVQEDPAPRKPETPRQGSLYLKIAGETDPVYRNVKAILILFPGENNVVLYFADTKIRRGTRCSLSESMVRELKKVLGDANVVIK